MLPKTHNGFTAHGSGDWELVLAAFQWAKGFATRLSSRRANKRPYCGDASRVP